jgi:hypothetical protein
MTLQSHLALLAAIADLALGASPLLHAAPLVPRTFEQVIRYLDAHPEITSVDAFLGALDPGTRGEFTLMYDSGSLQKGCVSVDHPRMIFMGTSYSDLMFAAAPDNGSPQCRDGNAVEFIEFIPEEARFEMRSIDFSGPKPVVSAPNPPMCLTCHSADPHPIWGSYFVWAGAYGSLDDTLLDEKSLGTDYSAWPEEYRGYHSFMTTVRSQGIYRHLDWSDGRDQINRGRPLHPKPGEDGIYNTKYRPNFALHRKVAYANRQRLLRMLREDPGFGDFKYAIRYAQSCSRVSGIGELMGELPEDARAKFAAIPIPRPIPDQVLSDYEGGPHAGDLSLLEPYGEFVADQARRVEISRRRLESMVPRRWWGFLPKGDRFNPTNTELPRRPDFMSLRSAETVSPVEYFLNAEGRTTRGWYAPMEGYIGTAGEEDALVVTADETDHLGCDALKTVAVSSLASWAASH